MRSGTHRGYWDLMTRNNATTWPNLRSLHHRLSRTGKIARIAILAGVAREHAFLCHDGDPAACADGCDMRPDPVRVAVYHRVGDLMLAEGEI
jgi:hypothetical protein